MVEPGSSSTILWDTLELSAEPLRGRSGILVTAHVKVRSSRQQADDEYRINFEINRHHGLVSHDTEMRILAPVADGPLWRYSGRRDIVVAVKDRFVATQLYAHMAGQLGWISNSEVGFVVAPLDLWIHEPEATIVDAIARSPEERDPVIDRRNIGPAGTRHRSAAGG